MQLQEKPLKLGLFMLLNIWKVYCYISIVGKLTTVVCKSNKYLKYLNMR